MYSQEAKTLITFLRRCKKFANDNTITSTLIVEGNVTVEDMRDVLKSHCGGLIAGVLNDVSEIQALLIEHYSKEGNSKMVEKLKKI